MRIRSLSYLFFLFLFTLCAWFGFGVAGQVSQGVRASAAQAAPAGQSNYLLVSLNAQKGGDAVLSSAWLALVKYDNPPSVMFKKVYPQAVNNADWQKSDIVVKEGTLPDAFKQRIDALHLPISTTVLLDSDILPALSRIFGISLPASQSLSGSRQPGATSEATQLKALCQKLSAGPRQKSGPASLRMSVTHWMDPWKGLVTSLRFASCEVLVGP